MCWFAAPQPLVVNWRATVVVEATVLRKHNGLTTASNVETRVFGQCKGAGFFENPEILGRWQVKRVAQVEDAIHAVLKARGRWKEDAPSYEWFNYPR